MKLKKIKKLAQSHIYWILLAVIIVFISFIRIRISSTPLERDEGEYAYMAQLLLQGIPPFKEAFNMKLPGTSIVYAFFMLLFGETVTAIHLGLLIVNICSIVLIFLLARKWFDSTIGIISAATFALLSINYIPLGFVAHATHFIIFFALAGIWSLVTALERRQQSWFWISGMLFGCAFLMKQTGVLFFFFGITILLLNRFVQRKNKKELLNYIFYISGGFLIPLAIVMLIIVAGGAFQKFWFWVIQYAFAYGNTLTYNDGMFYFKHAMNEFWYFLPWFCFFIVTGFILLCLGRFKRYTTWILSFFLLFSILAVLPGWHFREHYFIQMIPVCSLLIGAVFHYLREILRNRSGLKYIPISIFILFVAQNIYVNRMYYFVTTPIEIIHFSYNKNYFAEYIPISNFIAAHTTVEDRIAVLGSEPEVYFYTRRRSASGHIYTYGMMEPQPYARKMQEEFISDVEKIRPKYIVYVENAFSWLGEPTSDLYIFEWFTKFFKNYYKKTCVVDLIRVDNVKYIWGDDALKYEPFSPYVIYIYERIDRGK